MKIVSIFADELFAFHYTNERENELERLLGLWGDPSYLYQFLKENEDDLPRNQTILSLVKQIIENANEVDAILFRLSEDKGKGGTLDAFFKPLHNSEYRIVALSKRKGRKNYLRLYAIRIEANCYVITGGAIKLTRFMKERPHTDEELRKLSRCDLYLRDNGVFDEDSFFEFLNE